MQKTTFTTTMAYLSKLYGHNVEPEILKMYWVIVKDWTDEKYIRAVENIVKGFVPTATVKFPVPALFFQAAGDNRHDTAQNVITTVMRAIERHGAYKDIDFGDLALHAVIRRLGGWVELCGWTYEDWKFRTKEFLAAYEAAKSGAVVGDKQLVGIISQENHNTGYTCVNECVKIGEKPQNIVTLTEK